MWNLWRHGTVLQTIDALAPRLASWNRKDDPAQIALTAYLTDLMRRIDPLPAGQRLFLSLGVAVRKREHLTRFHDLENYLFPLFGPGCFRSAQFVLVSGTKTVGEGSTLQIGIAEPMDPDVLSNWSHHACAPGPGSQTKAWKERIHASLASAGPLPLEEGPVALHLAWRGASRRNWPWLWKPTADALGPVLGEVRPYNPLDDRIVELHLHWDADDFLGHRVIVGMWWLSLTR